jgi:hypothetical protein
MHSIGTEAGLVPEVDFSASRFGLLGDSWKGVTLPALNGLWSALIGSLQWPLLRQVEFGSQTAFRGHAQAGVEFLENQFADDISCPQTIIKTILQRVLANDPAKYLRLPCAFWCNSPPLNFFLVLALACVSAKTSFRRSEAPFLRMKARFNLNSLNLSMETSVS